MLLTYSVGMESSVPTQAVTARQKESVWSPIQEDSLRLFIEFFQEASVFHFCVLQVLGLCDCRYSLNRVGLKKVPGSLTIFFANPRLTKSHTNLVIS
jgi:hypothetical protein